MAHLEMPRHLSISHARSDTGKHIKFTVREMVGSPAAAGLASRWEGHFLHHFLGLLSLFSAMRGLPVGSHNFDADPKRRRCRLLGSRMHIIGHTTFTAVIVAVSLGGSVALADPGQGEQARATHSQADEKRVRDAGIDPSSLRPDWSIKDDNIAWDNGTLTTSIGTMETEADCPAGWTCLFADKNLTGRMLKWSAGGSYGNLSDNGFNDQMSSWKNRNARDARWYWDANRGGTTRCMNSNTANVDVGSGVFNTDNDEASSWGIYATGSGC